MEGDYDYIVVGAGSAGCVVANRLSADSANRVLLLEGGGHDRWIWFHVPVGYLFAIGNPRADSHSGGRTEHHGIDGEWRVEEPRLRWDVLDAVARAAVEMGISATDDFNTGDNPGVGYFHVNQKRGLRWSAARGFLKPVLRRPNLRLQTDVLADRVLFAGTRATGVRYLQEGQVREARVRHEVVLCAGAVGSPTLLQRSGVGPAEWLMEHGVRVLLDKPGVGRNLQDHLQQRAIYRVSGIKTLNETYHSLWGRALMGLEYALFQKGPLTMAPSQLGIFTHSATDHEARANIQFHVQPLSLDRFGDPLHRFPAITVAACNLQPTSRGTIRIRSADPGAKPVIAPAYLSTDADRQVAADAIRVTRRLMGQPALRPFSPVEYLPGPTVADDPASLARAAGDIGTTIFHPVGTAKMGLPSDPYAVVDERLRVFGLQGLRVVDASVMPTITSGNTNTPTIMIADKGSKMILADQRLN